VFKPAEVGIRAMRENEDGIGGVDTGREVKWIILSTRLLRPSSCEKELGLEF